MLDAAGAPGRQVSWWWIGAALALGAVTVWLRFSLARRMVRGNRAAGRPWWKGNGGTDLTTPMAGNRRYFWRGVAVATAALLFLVLFETIGGYHPRFNPLYVVIPVYVLLLVEAVVVVRRRRGTGR